MPELRIGENNIGGVSQIFARGPQLLGATSFTQQHALLRAVTASALMRASLEGRGYAYNSAPTSPYANLTGNKTPGVTRLMWLLNQNKCNQFVGDALSGAGVRMPTNRMPDGSEHYVIAESLPLQSGYFNRVGNLNDIKAGDVLVIDYIAGQGASTAHTEIITACNLSRGIFETTGAHQDGAYTKKHPDFFSSLRHNPVEFCWQSASSKVYVLRPKFF